MIDLGYEQQQQQRTNGGGTFRVKRRTECSGVSDATPSFTVGNRAKFVEGILSPPINLSSTPETTIITTMQIPVVPPGKRDP